VNAPRPLFRASVAADIETMAIFLKEKHMSELAMNHRPGAFRKTIATTACALAAAVPAVQALATQGHDEARPPAAVMAPSQIAGCSSEIGRAQVAWKYWRLDPREAVARLARMQKEIFEGRCAGHPQAQAYVAAAERVLRRTAPDLLAHR
jgi:hypothetical protein